MQKQPWLKNTFLFFFFGLISLAVMAPIASNTLIPSSHDFMNHLGAIAQAKMALLEGQFPLRIAPFEHAHMRYPLYQFSSPTSYAFAGLIYAGCHNPLIAYKFTIWFASVIGAIYLYRLAYHFVGSRYSAGLASVVYLTTPLHLILVNRMGAFNEVIAQGVLPVVLYYAFENYHHPQHLKSFLLAAFSWYLLATIHVVSFVYLSFFFFFILFVLSVKHYLPWEHGFRACFAYAFGWLLALWFMAPSALFGAYLKIQATLISLAVYNYFTPLAGLISPAASVPWPMNVDFMPINTPIHPALGWPILLAVGLCTYILFARQAVTHKKTGSLLLPLLILFFLSFFLTWSPIDFWQYVPKFFRIGQYSWRFLTQVTWIGALLFTWSACWLFDGKLDKRHFIVGTLLLAASTATWMPSVGSAPQTLENLLKNPSLGFSRDDYLLDIKKYPALGEFVESFSLNRESTTDHNGKSVTSAVLPRILLETAPTPSLLLTGTIVAKENQAHATAVLVVTLNDKVIASTPVKGGALSWQFTFDKKILAQFPKAETFQLAFQLQSRTPLALMVALKDVLFLGFLQAPHTLLVEKTAPHCAQYHTETECVLEVPAATQLVDLPVIYYPHLLDVKLNGKRVAYLPVLYHNYPVVGVRPLPHQKNIISVRFRGLPWANWISGMAWLAWLGGWIFNYKQAGRKLTFK